MQWEDVNILFSKLTRVTLWHTQPFQTSRQFSPVFDITNSRLMSSLVLLFSFALGFVFCFFTNLDL